MHKMLKALAMLVIASFVLAACGGSATNTPVPAATSTTAAAAAPTAMTVMTPTTAMTTGSAGTPTAMMAVTPTAMMAVTPTAMMAVTPTAMMAVTPTAMMAMTPMMTATAGMATTPAMTGTAGMAMTATVAAATPTTAGPAGPTNTPAPTATPIPPVSSNPNAKTTITLWTKEGEPTLSWIEKQAKAFSATHTDVNIVVVNKGVEDIKSQFPTSLAAPNDPSTPDFLWTVGDHIGVFAPGNLIADVDTAFGAGYNDKFLKPASDSAKYNGKSWGVPLSVGNHLMLMYNKKLVPTAPKTFDELITMAKAQTTGSGNNATYGLVFNQTEGFWLNPFLAGFGGWPLLNPDNANTAVGTLNTPEMVKTLQFLQDLNFKDKITLPGADYATADQLFKDGRAAFLINGDWSPSGYLTDSVKAKLDLGIAPIPQINSTGLWPAPMVAGVYIMVAAPTVGNADKMKAVKDFTDYLTTTPVQVDFAKTQTRLPATTAANADPAITGDPILSAESAALLHGKPQPVVPQMRCAFDAEKQPMQDVYNNKQSPADAAKAMQASYDANASSCKP